MLKKTAFWAALVWAALAAVASATPPTPQSEPSKAAAESDKSMNAYRLDFTLAELEDGKKINTRQYSMNSRANDWNEIKIGTRVPMEFEQGKYQYLDVGTSIRCRLTDQADLTSLGSNVSLSAHAEISNFAAPEQPGRQPIIRELRIEASTVLALGKPMVVGVVDDPNSRRQFQLEVTVTKLK